MITLSGGRALKWSPVVIVLLWAVYFGVIYVFAADGRGGADFQKIGVFGDSFGAFAALMSALAAAGALSALNFQLTESSRQAFDSNFFSLLSHFVDIVGGTDVQEYRTELNERGEEVNVLNREFVGRDALRIMLDELRDIVDYDSYPRRDEISKAYSNFYSMWMDDLGHYFRSLYHLFRLIDERCPSEKTFYARIVRAQLSNSELFLLGYNCVFGEGEEKFKNYLSQFHLLHNLDFSAAHAQEIQLFMSLPRSFYGRHRQVRS